MQARSLAWLGLMIVSCGGAPAPTTPKPSGDSAPRESGQSRLMDQTFAGQNKCNARNHDRPFVVEWDATDMSSFQALTTNDIVFVRYEDCNLRVIDSCNDASVRGALGAYKPIDWTTGAVEKVDIGSTLDLYAKLPLGVELLGGRVQSGETFSMQYFVSGTRTATRPVLHRGELAKFAGCAGVTHFVYAYNLGAYQLASGSSTRTEATAMGAGARSRDASNVEKKAGELTACTKESAREIDACKAPIRLTLREIADGEAPDSVAARAPETPDALNLAGKLQASTAQERAAGEHAMSAQTKMQVGDGKGCLADLDAHDRLDPRPGGLSTNPRGYGRMRSLCLMLAGQCDAGKALARKSMEAAASTLTPNEIDRSIDGDVAGYCRGGAMSERDRFLRALRVLDSRQERVSVAACQEAYGTATRLVEVVKPRDNYDMAHDARHRISMNGPQCFARAGDCKAAWRVAKEQDEAYGKHRGFASTDSSKRSRFLSATDDLCIDKDQGTLSDAELVYRSIEELKRARPSTPRSVAFCMARIDQGVTALGKVSAALKADEMKYTHNYLAESGAECLAVAKACEGAWKQFSRVRRAFEAPEDPLERRIREAFRNKVRECRFQPQGVTSPRERVLWAAGVLEDASRDRVEAKLCLATLDAAKRAAAEDKGDRKINSEWHYGTRDIPRDAGRCLQKAGDCSAAFKAFQDAQPVFGWRKIEPAELRKAFESDVSECKGR